MPQPTPQQLHIDRYLTNMAINWSQSQDSFVADKVFPIVPVIKESDLYAFYEKGYFYRDELQPRPLGGRPPEAGWGVTNKPYRCVEWALEDKIDDRIRQNADQPLDPDLAAMRLLTGQTLIHRDVLWAKQFFTSASGWSTSAAPGATEKWSSSASEPLPYIDEKKLEMKEKTGYMPNVLVIGSSVWKAIRNHREVLERIKYTQRGLVTLDLLAAMFDVEKVLVPFGVVNTAQEGEADKIGFIADSHSALLTYAAPAPSIQTPSAGYTFAYTGLVPGVTNAFGGVIERGREELAHSDVIQIRASYDQRVTAPELGTWLQLLA